MIESASRTFLMSFFTDCITQVYTSLPSVIICSLGQLISEFLLHSLIDIITTLFAFG